MSMPYTIARLAAAAGVHVETVRYYQRRSLVPKPDAARGEIRRYGEADAERLRFIKRAQSIGFTLAEIRNLLALRANNSCHATRELAATKLELVNRKVRELRHLRGELIELIRRCDANTEESSCPAIRQLESGPARDMEKGS